MYNHPTAGESEDLTSEHPDTGAIERTEDILRWSVAQRCQSRETGKLWLYHDGLLVKEERKGSFEVTTPLEVNYGTPKGAEQ